MMILTCRSSGVPVRGCCFGTGVAGKWWESVYWGGASICVRSLKGGTKCCSTSLRSLQYSWSHYTLPPIRVGGGLTGGGSTEQEEASVSQMEERTGGLEKVEMEDRWVTKVEKKGCPLMPGVGRDSREDAWKSKIREWVHMGRRKN